MRQLMFVLFFIVVVAASASFTNAQRPDPTGKGRYTIVTNEIFTQPAYTGPDSLDGLGKKTAEELGLTGKRVYNEYPGGPKLVILSAKAVIFYDTGSLEPIYLDGCLIKGKYRPNRIKLEEVVIVEKEKIVAVEKKVEVPVEKIVKVETKVEVPVFPCPVFTGARYGSKGFGSRMPSAMELLVGAGKGALIGAIGSNEDRLKAALLSAGLSAADTTITNMLIPDKNVLYLDGPFAIMVKKGKSATSPDGRFILSWQKGDTILGTLVTGEVCFAGSVQQSFNTGSIGIVYRKGGTKQTIPIKTQTLNQIPDRGGVAGNNGGQIPGNGVPVIPGNGIPTRPRRPFAEEGSGNGLQTDNSFVNRSTNNTNGTTCTGQLITLGGKQRCVNN